MSQSSLPGSSGVSSRSDTQVPLPKLQGCSPIDMYILSRKLGEGTFGQVHKGIFKPTHTAVALKEIMLHDNDDGIPITALREIKIMKALRHPNLLYIMDMAVSKGSSKSASGTQKTVKPLSTYYMVLSYMDHDLCGLLHNKEIRFTLPHIKLYMAQLLAGMSYLHDQQYMHRDIKSANVLVSNNGNLKIADFGLARKYSEAPPDLASATPAARKYTPKVVTRWYRPPELLLGEQYYTTAIDMWGIGCIFGEFFKRREILPGQSDMDQIHRIFQLVGSPNMENMPTFAQLPVARELMPVPEKLPTIHEVFSTVPEDAVNLLSNFLTLDPLKRLTAKGALAHKFFTEGVQAAQLGDLPIFPSSRELDVRRKREAPSPLPPPPGMSSKRTRARAFVEKIPNKPELRPADRVAPYKRNDSQYQFQARNTPPLDKRGRVRYSDSRRSLGGPVEARGRKDEEQKVTVMSNGLNY